jgi:transposase
MGALGFDTTTRHKLEEVLRYPHTTRQLKRAQALLWADDGEPITKVAERLRITRQSVHNWVHWIAQRDGPIAERLMDAPRNGRPRDKAELTDEVIPKLLPSDPTEHGYRARGWTNQLLRDYLYRHCRVEVSRYTIQQAIKRAGYRWKRPRYVLSRRAKTWRQAKGGSNAA